VPLLSANCVQPVNRNWSGYRMLASLAGLSSSLVAVCWSFDFAVVVAGCRAEP